MKRKRTTKFQRHGSLYSEEEPGRSFARKRSGGNILEVQEADVVAEYDLSDFERLEVPEYEAIEIEK
jgi:hypothetical protein